MATDNLDECKSLEDVEELLTGRMSEHHLCIDCGFDTRHDHQEGSGQGNLGSKARREGERHAH